MIFLNKSYFVNLFLWHILMIYKVIYNILHFIFMNYFLNNLRRLVLVGSPILIMFISYNLSVELAEYFKNLYFIIQLSKFKIIAIENILSSIIIMFYALNCIFIIKYNNDSNQNIIKRIIFAMISFIFFIFVLNTWPHFDINWSGYQFIASNNIFWSFIQLNFGFDGLTLCFISLTTLVFVLIFSYLAFDNRISTGFLTCCILIEIFLFLSFYTINLLLFYIFFESVLIPMFLMIIYWGSSQRKIKAALYFLLYTLIGSIFLLYAILYIYSNFGTLNYMDFTNIFLSIDEEIILWLSFFFPFAVKIPMFPFHIWLPEAHVEAPTIGSIILASLLLKLGGYGLIRFTLSLFPNANIYFFPIISVFSLLGVLNASFIAIRQSDIKRIIAYSSIAHMNLIVLGIFSMNKYGLDGSVYLMIGHGLVSTALFFCVGVLYDRYHTRLIQYYGGLVQLMPKFTIVLLIFTFSNMGFPGTMNFIGEFLVLLGIVQENFFCGILAALSTVLSAVYSIYLFNRISYGTIKIFNNKIMIDLTLPELSFLTILAILTILLGLKASLILQSIQFLIF